MGGRGAAVSGRPQGGEAGMERGSPLTRGEFAVRRVRYRRLSHYHCVGVSGRWQFREIAFQKSADRVAQLLDGKWLAEHVLGTTASELVLETIASKGADDEHRQRRQGRIPARANRAQNLPAALQRQKKIEDQEIRRRVAERSERRGAVGDDREPITVLLEVVGDQVRDRGVVLRYQDPPRSVRDHATMGLAADRTIVPIRVEWPNRHGSMGLGRACLKCHGRFRRMRALLVPSKEMKRV